MRGRRPKPTNLKLLDGNPGHKPLPRNEPKPPFGVPVKPQTVIVDPLASAEWERLVKLTSAKAVRVLTVADGPMLEGTCLAYAEFARAMKVLREQGPSYETITRDGGILFRKRPEADVATQFLGHYRNFLGHFGLSPAMRAKVERISDDDEARDPAEAHFE